MSRLWEWFTGWRFFILAYIVCSGIWSVLAKFASSRLNPSTQTLVAVTTASAVVIIATFRGFRWQSSVGMAAALVCGVLGGVASIAFYNALRQAPASVVMPLSSLYLVLTVVLSFLFLGERLGLKQYAGILFGLIAIVLLTSAR